MNADNHVPHEDGRWKFDETVAANFDAMLENSIPMYQEMRDLCHALGKNFVAEGNTVIDLGASRGEALRPFIEDNEAAKFIALEISEPMRNVLQELYGKNDKVWISSLDLRELETSIEAFTGLKTSLILSVLTIQFTPIEYRQQIIQTIYDMLEPGGAFIFVEKVLGNNAKVDSLFVKEYYGMKNANGYSYEDIQRKRSSLEGVLVPVTASWNEDLLNSAGFRGVDCFYRNLNFAGWIAIK